MVRLQRVLTTVAAGLCALALAACGGGGSSGTPIYSIGGTISGLANDGLVIANGSDAFTIRAGASAFTLPKSLPEGASYAVTIKAQPVGQSCSVSGSSGLVGTAPVTSVAVTCAALSWAWIAGPVDPGTAPVYGLAGLADAANRPGARRDAVTWVDAAGDLWMFGGEAADASATLSYPNDLWRYSTTSGQWTWVGGGDATDTRGVYGTQGVAAATNVPGGRHWAMSWIDAQGRLWLFGGVGYDSANAWGLLNDLWSFDPASEEWTWWSGAPVLGGRTVAGMPGAFDPTYTPGPRDGAVAWRDAAGNFWMYGGFGDDADGLVRGELDELWEFSTASSQWSLQAGSGVANAAPVYGVLGVAQAGNTPGGRDSAIGWIDGLGAVWMFGGRTYLGLMNDLWRLDPATRAWTWVAGPAAGGTPGVYGTRGRATADAVPGARSLGAGWTASNGDLWLFGGSGFGPTYAIEQYNDVWVFRPAIGQWSWILGSSDPMQGATRGPATTFGAAYTPGARVGAAGWFDASGRYWLYGGAGVGDPGVTGDFGDLWLLALP